MPVPEESLKFLTRTWQLADTAFLSEIPLAELSNPKLVSRRYVDTARIHTAAD